MSIKPQSPVDDKPDTPAPVQRAPFGGFADNTTPKQKPVPEEPKDA